LFKQKLQIAFFPQMSYNSCCRLFFKHFWQSSKKASSFDTIRFFITVSNKKTMQQSPIILTVSDLTNALKSHIEPLFRHVSVRGEITNYKLQTSGHHYFSLIDEGAQLSAVLFKGNAAQCKQPLKNGDTVVATGEISLYPPRGCYQLVVRQISHVGLGEALLRLQALKKKLFDLGWFSVERKRALPSEIRKIGLVTSPTGAVLHDIYTILCRRMGSFHLIINPVRVQGEGAALEIARAISEFSSFHLADVIIVCRGGGSAEDLAAFNEEIVAKACFESTIPIISAVGHETDVTIVDLVADLRAPTPSAAAELVSKEKGEQKRRLDEYFQVFALLMETRVNALKDRLKLFSKRLSHVHPQKLIENYRMRLDDLGSFSYDATTRSILFKKKLLHQFKRNIEQLSPTMKVLRQRQRCVQMQKSLHDRLLYSIGEKRERLASLYRHLKSLMHNHLTRAKLNLQAEKREKHLNTLCKKKIAAYRDRLAFFTSNLSALNPKKVLERGYSIVFTENNRKVIRSIQETSSGDRIQILVSDGTFQATVQSNST
jgi:exodeoxyribonuclease VII large subunit